jgi:hypothetical protein
MACASVISAPFLSGIDSTLPAVARGGFLWSAWGSLLPFAVRCTKVSNEPKTEARSRDPLSVNPEMRISSLRHERSSGCRFDTFRNS